VMANLYSSSTVAKKTMAKKRKARARKKQTSTEVQFSLPRIAQAVLLPTWLSTML
jgi:hypothetical protein